MSSPQASATLAACFVGTTALGVLYCVQSDDNEKENTLRFMGFWIFACLSYFGLFPANGIDEEPVKQDVPGTASTVHQEKPQESTVGTAIIREPSPEPVVKPSTQLDEPANMMSDDDEKEAEPAFVRRSSRARTPSRMYTPEVREPRARSVGRTPKSPALRTRKSKSPSRAKGTTPRRSTRTPSGTYVRR